jgi:hypothetical protein
MKYKSAMFTKHKNGSILDFDKNLKKRQFDR